LVPVRHRKMLSSVNSRTAPSNEKRVPVTKRGVLPLRPFVSHSKGSLQPSPCPTLLCPLSNECTRKTLINASFPSTDWDLRRGGAPLTTGWTDSLRASE